MIFITHEFYLFLYCLQDDRFSMNDSI